MHINAHNCRVLKRNYTHHSNEKECTFLYSSHLNYCLISCNFISKLWYVKMNFKVNPKWVRASMFSLISIMYFFKTQIRITLLVD